ncbi:hypothetical protein YC2023_034675 [Brassica napus]|uniref:Uncharacterized protein n=3 Tax=Brassica TaxID=3705 RepID=A0A0D3B1E7_BRAOL|nr:unnamed protein product [Brassica napus]VDC86479.1 unnamed protein product [Brassica oleracea]
MPWGRDITDMSSRSPHLVCFLFTLWGEHKKKSSRIVANLAPAVLDHKGKKSVNDIMMESKAGNNKPKSSLFYEAPLGYSIEDVRPFGGIKKFKSSVYSNCAKRPS